MYNEWLTNFFLTNKTPLNISRATDLRIATITATATISISDFNEAPPVFEEVSTTVRVNDAAQVGKYRVQ